MVTSNLRKIEGKEDLFANHPYLEVLYEAAKKVPSGGTIVELGCYYGKSTSTLANGNRNVKIYAVDHFNGSPSEPEEFEKVNARIKAMFGVTPREAFFQNIKAHPHATLLECDFAEALGKFEDSSIDMIFLDGDHMTTYRELAAWWPKVKPGGAVYGHDLDQERFTVKEDLERFCREQKLSYSAPHSEVFLLRKPTEKKPHAYVITMGHNTKKYAKACVLSVTDCLKSYPNTTHVIVDDWSDDGTWERYHRDDLRGDHQILVRPPARTGSPLASFMFGLSQVQPEPFDVIFWLDADDWLIDEKAIKMMMDPYLRNPVTEMAYSQHLWYHGKDKEPTLGISRIIQEPAMVRPDWVRFSHFRSFRFDMLEKVPGHYLRQTDGKYWETCGDSALFLPMLEVAKKVAYVDKPLYAYNVSTGANEWSSNKEKVIKNSIRVRTMYPNLNFEKVRALRFPPVRRFKVDFGRACDIRCRGCYYAHQKDKFNLTTEQVYEVIKQGAARGCRACDISGGEPTIYKDLPRWINFALKHGVAPGIITHGQRLEPMLPMLWSAGLKDILFSVHGDERQHNWWTQTDDGYKKMWGALEKCASEKFKFRTNTVLHSGYRGLPAMARDLAKVKPYISNFINFNPYYEWGEQDKPFQAKISDIAPYLKDAIDILTEAGTMVNVRYFPFCALKGYEKHFVDMSQVMFDPYEWDYGVMPKTIGRYNEYGVELASRTREYADKCIGCAAAETVCYGANKVYLAEFGDEELNPYEGAKINDRFHFRQHADRRQLYTYIGANHEWSYRGVEQCARTA